jgi:hypothetical protein
VTINNPDVIKRAQELGSRIRAENGVQNAVKAVYFELSRMKVAGVHVPTRPKSDGALLDMVRSSSDQPGTRSDDDLANAGRTLSNPIKSKHKLWKKASASPKSEEVTTGSRFSLSFARK